jgi:hypothetical protein
MNYFSSGLVLYQTLALSYYWLTLAGYGLVFVRTLMAFLVEYLGMLVHMDQRYGLCGGIGLLGDSTRSCDRLRESDGVVFY